MNYGIGAKYVSIPYVMCKAIFLVLESYPKLIRGQHKYLALRRNQYSELESVIRVIM